MRQVGEVQDNSNHDRREVDSEPFTAAAGNMTGTPAFSEPAADDPFTADEVKREPRPGGIILLSALLIGAAVAGGIVWFNLRASYDQASGAVKAPTIFAQETPYKIKPADPGGARPPNQDKLVYSRINPSKATKERAGLPSPQVPATAVPTPQPSIKGDAIPPSSSKGGAVTAVPSILEVSPPEVVNVERAATLPPAPVAPVKPRILRRSAPSATDDASGHGLKAAVGGNAVSPAREGPTSPSPSVGAVNASYMVQLAALRSEDDARRQWDVLLEKYPALLGDLSRMIERVDLGVKGVFYRLRAKGVPNAQAARALCKKFAAQKVECLFVGKTALLRANRH